MMQLLQTLMADRETDRAERQASLAALQQLANNQQGHGHHDHPGSKLKNFQNTNPPVFSKTEEPLDADDWLQTMENNLEVAGVDENEKVLFATHYLAGPARAWWTSARALNAGQMMTWADFKLKFSKYHVPPGLIKKMRDEFRELKQGRMSVVEYRDRFLTLSRYAPDETDTNEKRKERFLNGLHDEMQTVLVNIPFADLEALVDSSIQMEGKLHQANENRKRRMMNQMSRPGFQNRSGGNPRPGGPHHNSNNPNSYVHHNSNFNRAPPRAPNNNNNNTNTAPRTGSNAIPVGTKDKSTITCYECGVVGHFSNECPKRLAKLAGNTAAPAQQQRRVSTGKKFAPNNPNNRSGRLFHMSAEEAQEAPDVVLATPPRNRKLEAAAGTRSSPEQEATPGRAAATREILVLDNDAAHLSDDRRCPDAPSDPLLPPPVSPALTVDDDAPQPSIGDLIARLPSPRTASGVTLSGGPLRWTQYWAGPTLFLSAAQLFPAQAHVPRLTVGLHWEAKLMGRGAHTRMDGREGEKKRLLQETGFSSGTCAVPDEKKHRVEEVSQFDGRFEDESQFDAHVDGTDDEPFIDEGPAPEIIQPTEGGRGPSTQLCVEVDARPEIIRDVRVVSRPPNPDAPVDGTDDEPLIDEGPAPEIIQPTEGGRGPSTQLCVEEDAHGDHQASRLYRKGKTSAVGAMERKATTHVGSWLSLSCVPSPAKQVGTSRFRAEAMGNENSAPPAAGAICSTRSEMPLPSWAGTAQGLPSLCEDVPKKKLSHGGLWGSNPQDFIKQAQSRKAFHLVVIKIVFIELKRNAQVYLLFDLKKKKKGRQPALPPSGPQFRSAHSGTGGSRVLLPAALAGTPAHPRAPRPGCRASLLAPGRLVRAPWPNAAAASRPPARSLALLCSPSLARPLAFRRRHRRLAGRHGLSLDEPNGEFLQPL
ncbi:hypothetical protein QYE76_066232 [Lolium multiflorum]|uniref:CCHC-type domain-containing protein n=1 Tax=Lolium multiflorum TaxID=4521 RepID=A0AAD8SA77_LOLMU|nr:hypothetical protein QYE76_066232 [Lolium multiflorum]